MLTTTVCAALSAAGLAVAFLTAYRRRFVAATRIAALALVPVGLAMAGLIGLGGEIGTAVGGWAADLVLRPTVWAGFGVLAVAVVLYVIARFAGRRRAGRAERRAAVSSGAGSRQAAPSKSATAGATPALKAGETPSPESRPTTAGTAEKPASGGADDFSDIEAILKKHGI
ncbi:MAG: hypothetical protein ACRDP3_25725 [Streptomyces sp.]|uniref:hypothetical protein n=1 Tax=Streptomyces sp. TaxID=1931 RepID=UPI003D6C0814